LIEELRHKTKNEQIEFKLNAYNTINMLDKFKQIHIL